MPAIQTTRLTKTYGKQRGIEEIDLIVDEGEVFGLLGPNGAGKTTLIRTLLDLLHPTSGTAMLLGMDSRRSSMAIRARLGNLPGDFAYGPPTLTGREIMEFFGRVRGLSDLGRADELAERFHADLDRPISQLSRGNRQKIGLVQALFHSPDLIVLDEPTGGLDPLMQEEFLKLVAEERARGATVLLSSHTLAEVERVCDRVGIIRAGRLVAVEQISELVGKSYRHVSLKFSRKVAKSEFARLPGVTDVGSNGNEISFKATGSLDAIVKQAAKHQLIDMQLAHPSLEELFLGYYERGEAS